MSVARSQAVVVDTMVVSSLVNAARQPAPAAQYRSLIADRWIAATAIRLGIELVSDDAAFRDAPGLAVITNSI